MLLDLTIVGSSGALIVERAMYSTKTVADMMHLIQIPGPTQ